MLAFAAVTALMCGGLVGAAALVPAPAAVLPLVALVCVGAPMLAAWQLSEAAAALGGLRSAFGRDRRPLDERALAELRRSLERLPETRHPLDL